MIKKLTWKCGKGDLRPITTMFFPDSIKTLNICSNPLSSIGTKAIIGGWIWILKKLFGGTQIHTNMQLKG
jgi:hypothetical protein